MKPETKSILRTTVVGVIAVSAYLALTTDIRAIFRPEARPRLSPLSFASHPNPATDRFLDAEVGDATKLTELSEFHQLSELNITGTGSGEGTKVPPAWVDSSELASLHNLNSISFYHARPKNFAKLADLPDLRELRVEDCPDWQALSHLPALTRLYVSGCTDLAGFHLPPALRFLNMGSCSEKCDISVLAGALGKLKSLSLPSRRLNVHDVAVLKSLPGLTDLTIDDGDVKAIRSLPPLTSLRIQHPSLTTLDALVGQTGLTNLEIGLPGRSDWFFCVREAENHHASFQGCGPDPGVAVASALESLPALEALTVFDTSGPGGGDSGWLSKLNNLRRLTIAYDVTDLSGLSKLESLRVLDIRSNRLSDVTPLGTLHNLTVLTIVDASGTLRDVSALRSLSHLESLSLYGSKISDISALQNLDSLITFTINSGMTIDLTPLAFHSDLRLVDIGATKVQHVEAIPAYSASTGSPVALVKR